MIEVIIFACVCFCYPSFCWHNYAKTLNIVIARCPKTCFLQYIMDSNANFNLSRALSLSLSFPLPLSCYRYDITPAKLRNLLVKNSVRNFHFSELQVHLIPRTTNAKNSIWAIPTGCGGVRPVSGSRSSSCF